MTPAQEHAYRTTRYVVDPIAGRSAESIVLRVGELSPALDAALGAGLLPGWAFLTAWNPFGERTALEDNTRAQQKLLARLERLGLPSFPGRGIGADPSWTPEESVLVVGIARSAARRLGEELEQQAIVVGRPGERAELLSCLPERPKTKGPRCG